MTPAPMNVRYPTCPIPEGMLYSTFILSKLLDMAVPKKAIHNAGCTSVVKSRDLNLKNFIISFQNTGQNSVFMIISSCEVSGAAALYR